MKENEMDYDSYVLNQRVKHLEEHVFDFLGYNVPIKKLSDTAVVPTKGSNNAAGYDLYADSDATIAAHETVKMSTGIAVALPEHTFGAIFARSGLATKQGLRPANCVGKLNKIQFAA